VWGGRYAPYTHTHTHTLTHTHTHMHTHNTAGMLHQGSVNLRETGRSLYRKWPEKDRFLSRNEPENLLPWPPLRLPCERGGERKVAMYRAFFVC